MRERLVSRSLPVHLGTLRFIHLDTTMGQTLKIDLFRNGKVIENTTVSSVNIGEIGSVNKARIGALILALQAAQQWLVLVSYLPP